jgi:CRISPR-associated protein Csy2
MKKYLTITNVKIEEANAFSSPYTVGFPAITSFLGFMHRLQRELSDEYTDLKLNKIGIICNDFDLRVYKDSQLFYSNLSVIEKRHPLLGTGKTDSFIEEPLCNLEVSLLIEYDGVRKLKESQFIEDVETLLHSRMKIASGNIISYKNVFLKRIDDNSENDDKKFLRSLNKGFSIINRKSLIENDMIQNSINAFDSVISFIQVNTKAEIDEKEVVEWSRSKKLSNGWFVPISVGYQGLDELKHVENQRNNDYLHRFAEAIVTLGEFVMPYRLDSIDQMLWQYEYDEINNLYICK